MTNDTQRTPRTDAMFVDYEVDMDGVTLRDRVAVLERELSAAESALAEANVTHANSMQTIGVIIAKLQSDLAAAQRDAGRLALEEAAKGDLGDLLSKNQAAITEYVADYELTSDEGYYTPKKFESELIMDAIQGLIADDDFVKTFNAWQSAIRALAAQQPGRKV